MWLLKNHNFERHLIPGRKAVTNLDSVLKSRDITLLTEVFIVKADDFIWYSIDDAEVIRRELAYPPSTKPISLPAFVSAFAAFLPFGLPLLRLRPPACAFGPLLKFSKVGSCTCPPSLSSASLLLHHFQTHKHAAVPCISPAPLHSCPLQRSLYVLCLHFLSSRSLEPVQSGFTMLTSIPSYRNCSYRGQQWSTCCQIPRSFISVPAPGIFSIQHSWSLSLKLLLNLASLDTTFVIFLLPQWLFVLCLSPLFIVLQLNLKWWSACVQILSCHILCNHLTFIKYHLYIGNSQISFFNTFSSHNSRFIIHLPTLQPSLKPNLFKTKFLRPISLLFSVSLFAGSKNLLFLAAQAKLFGVVLDSFLSFASCVHIGSTLEYIKNLTTSHHPSNYPPIPGLHQLLTGEVQ